MRLENTWEEIRDHSFIQNLSRSFRFPAPWLCFFSSVHLTHFLQGSGQRTGRAIAEDWFCAQWPVFEVCVLDYCRCEVSNMAHYKISNRVSHLLIFILECSKLWIWMGIYFRDILLRISKGANNCVQRVFEKNIDFIRIFPPILNSYYTIKG